MEDNSQVWSVKLDQAVLPTLLPWLDTQMERLTFNRVRTEECFILYICLPTMGVVPAGKQNFVLQLVTGFLSARPNNSIAVILHANRASDSKRACEAQAISVSLCLTIDSYMLFEPTVPAALLSVSSVKTCMS